MAPPALFAANAARALPFGGHRRAQTGVDSQSRPRGDIPRHHRHHVLVAGERPGRGRAEELGRPLLYGTTKRFLEVFGLAAIKDLPPVNDVFPGLSNLITEQKPASKAVAKDASDPEDSADASDESSESQPTTDETDSGDSA